MGANQMLQAPCRRAPVAVAAAAAAALAACTGDNLFFGPALSDQGPQVTITAPTDSAAVAQNDSILVTADVAASRGIKTVVYSGLLNSGGAAFNQVTIFVAGSTADTTLSAYLVRSVPTTGDGKVIVQATDGLGEVDADTVVVVLK